MNRCTRFADVAQRAAAEVRAGAAVKQQTVDRLYDAAIAYGLVDAHGDDVIQNIFHEAFHARR